MNDRSHTGTRFTYESGGEEFEEERNTTYDHMNIAHHSCVHYILYATHTFICRH